MKKHLSQLIMFIGFVVVVLGLILDPLVITSGKEAKTAMISALVGTVNIAAVLAVCFIFAKNKVVVNVGYGLAGVLGAYGLNYIATIKFLVSCVGFAIMAIGALIYFIMLLISFFGYVKGGSCGNNGDVATSLNSYKEMQKDNIITEEEFEALKSKELASVKVSTLGDLKKWKKLLDQKVITEEEFASIKSNILKA